MRNAIVVLLLGIAVVVGCSSSPSARQPGTQQPTPSQTQPTPPPTRTTPPPTGQEAKLPQLIDAQYGEVGKEQDVLLLPTPTTLKAHVANTTAVQWRLTNLDMHEFLWLDGEQVKPGYWESEWGNAFPPPPSPGYLLLYAQVQPGVPDSPDFRRQGDLRWALLAKVKVKAE